MKKILGYALLGLPFLVIMSMPLWLPGVEWWMILRTFGISVVVILVLLLGMYLISR